MTSPPDADADSWSKQWLRWSANERGPLVDTVLAPIVRSQIQPGALVLDVGAGDGTLASIVANCGARVVSLELRPRLAVACKSRSPWTVVGDGLDLPFRDSCFDQVVSIMALQEIAEPEAVVSEIARVLRRLGTFTLIVSHPLSTIVGDDRSTIVHTYGDSSPFSRTVRRTSGEINYSGYQHSLSRYLVAFIVAGFALTDLDEPSYASSVEWSRLPRFLVLTARLEDLRFLGAGSLHDGAP